MSRITKDRQMNRLRKATIEGIVKMLDAGHTLFGRKLVEHVDSPLRRIEAVASSSVHTRHLTCFAWHVADLAECFYEVHTEVCTKGILPRWVKKLIDANIPPLYLSADEARFVKSEVKRHAGAVFELLLMESKGRNIRYMKEVATELFTACFAKGSRQHIPIDAVPEAVERLLNRESKTRSILDWTRRKEVVSRISSDLKGSQGHKRKLTDMVVRVQDSYERSCSDTDRFMLEIERELGI